MTTQMATLEVVLLGLWAGCSLGWLQWRLLKRLLGRPNEWVAAGVVGAAVSTPLSTAMLLDALLQAGLPTAAILPAGVGLLIVQVVLGAGLVAAVAWAMGKR